MPELPEVEVVKQSLEKYILNKNLLKIICQSLTGKLRINSNSLLFTLIPQILIVRAGTNNKHIHGKMINNNLGEAKSELKKSETKKADTRVKKQIKIDVLCSILNLKTFLEIKLSVVFRSL